jgi:hypothetical protein
MMIQRAVFEPPNNLGAMIKFDADPLSPTPLANGICRSAAAEGITDEIAGTGGDLNHTIKG